MRGPAQLASRIAYAMTLVGFLVIFLSWNGAASFDTIQQQFPYLMSGGLGGLGLIIAAMAILYAQHTRQLTAKQTAQLEGLNADMEKLLSRVTQSEVARSLQELRREAHTPAEAEETISLPVQRPDGSGGLALASSTVVAGRSSYHTHECHLVAGKDDLPRLPREDAEERGLTGCRICKP